MRSRFVAVLVVALVSAVARVEGQEHAVGTSVPSPEEAARAALDGRARSVLEVQRLQLRESQLEDQLRRPSLAGPGVGLGLSVPAALVLLPLGAVFMAIASDQYGETDDFEYGVKTTTISDDRRARTRRIGGVLLGLGVGALIGVVYCAIKVRRIRQHRARVEGELEETREKHGKVLEWLIHPTGTPAWLTLP